MQPERIEEMLSNYRLCKGKAAHLRIEVEILAKRVEDLKESAMADAALPSQKYDDMPHGSGTSDNTARIAIQFADGFKPRYIMENEQDLRSLTNELHAAESVIRFVEAWLDSLTDRERFVIEEKICNGSTWNNVTDGFRDRFGIAYSRDGLKRIKEKALKKIQLMTS